MEYQKPLIVNYVNPKNPLENIYHRALWQISIIFNLPHTYITIFKVLYEGILQDSFKVEPGVQKGEIPSPFFFLVVIDYIMTHEARHDSE